MIWAAVIGMVLATLLLFFVDAITIKSSTISIYELKRRKKAGDEIAARLLLRETQLAGLLSLQRLVSSLLLVILIVLSIASFGWMWGIVYGVGVVLIRDLVARLPYLRRRADAQFHKVENDIVTAISTHKLLRLLLRYTVFTKLTHQTFAVASKEELLHIAKESPSLLNEQEEALLQHSLQFSETKISDLMIPAEEVQAIKKGELLGPLILDDLHKKGHSHFPVVGNDINRVVGILQVKNSLVLDTTKKHTAKVETAMDPHVFYIEQNQTLNDALETFLGNHCHMLIVTNEERETVGIITLGDVIKALFGREIGGSTA